MLMLAVLRQLTSLTAGEVTNFPKAFIFPSIKIVNKKAGC
jgi:hypothetical protein